MGGSLVWCFVCNEYSDLFSSPPFGPACFWLKSVAPADITLQEIFISVLPFIALQIIGMLLVMFYPDIALWFPKYLSG